MDNSIDTLQPSKTRQILSWLLVALIVSVFLPSLTFKFTGAPETKHIFGTIGLWMAGFLGETIGGIFSAIGGYVIGTMELVASLMLLTPVFIWLANKRRSSGAAKDTHRQVLHAFGGLLTSALMGGAIFFHLFSKLGINVNNDNGALFYSAVAVFFAGIALFLINRDREPCPNNTRIGRFLHNGVAGGP